MTRAEAEERARTLQAEEPERHPRSRRARGRATPMTPRTGNEHGMPGGIG